MSKETKEKYREITARVAVDYIISDDTKNIYFKTYTEEIAPIDKYNVPTNEINKRKWFIREGI